jgi:hypothetical protein
VASGSHFTQVSISLSSGGSADVAGPDEDGDTHSVKPEGFTPSHNPDQIDPCFTNESGSLETVKINQFWHLTLPDESYCIETFVKTSCTESLYSYPWNTADDNSTYRLILLPAHLKCLMARSVCDPSSPR